MADDIENMNEKDTDTDKDRAAGGTSDPDRTVLAGGTIFRDLNGTDAADNTDNTGDSRASSENNENSYANNENLSENRDFPRKEHKKRKKLKARTIFLMFLDIILFIVLVITLLQLYEGRHCYSFDSIIYGEEDRICYTSDGYYGGGDFRLHPSKASIIDNYDSRIYRKTNMAVTDTAHMFVIFYDSSKKAIATIEDTGCGIIMVHSGNAFDSNGIKAKTGWIKYHYQAKKIRVMERYKLRRKTHGFACVYVNMALKRRIFKKSGNFCKKKGGLLMHSTFYIAIKTILLYNKIVNCYKT